jgi:hypothetical protein
MQAMERQGFLPKAKASTVAVFGHEIRDQVTGPSKNSLYIPGETLPYTDSSPAVVNFVKQFKRYFPGKKQHIWNVEGYRGALMFGDSIAALGANVTRQGMMDWLNALVNYDPHGLGTKVDFKLRGPSYYQTASPPPTCLTMAHFQDSDFFSTPGGAIKCVQGDWIKARED